MSLHRELIITLATVCDNTGVNIMWCLWPPVYCDTTGDGKNRLRLRDGAPGPAMSLDTLLPRESGVHPTSRPAARCWVLRLKLTPGAAQIWDRVGIDIDPSQTNERPQISECGAAWSSEKLISSGRELSLKNVLRKLTESVMGVSVTGWWLACWSDITERQAILTNIVSWTWDWVWLSSPDKSNWWSHSFIVHWCSWALS